MQGEKWPPEPRLNPSATIMILDAWPVPTRPQAISSTTTRAKADGAFCPIVEWLVVFEQMASKRQVAVRQIPGGNGRIGQISDMSGRLFDHLIGQNEQVMRNSEAECGLEVDDDINSVGCSTCMSPGFAERILSTISAARRNRAGKFGP
jgi:hypothetical protein